MTRFEIPGPPKGKGRPRSTKRGITYTPKDTVEYENLVRECYKEVNGPMLEGALWIEIDALYPIPKSTSKKQGERMLLDSARPTKKPDCDNISKIICDALNGIAYKDDSQIVEMTVNKFYGETPGVMVDLGKLDEY